MCYNYILVNCCECKMLRTLNKKKTDHNSHLAKHVLESKT